MSNNLKIPETYAKGFADVFSLETNDFTFLVDCISNYDPHDDHTTFENTLHAKLNNELSRSITMALFSLGVALSYADNNFLAFKETLSDTLAQSDRGINYDDNLSEKIDTILKASENIILYSKSKHLKLQHDKNFAYGRIFTDIRMIYNDSVDKFNDYAVIIHELEINFHYNNNMKSIYINLDHLDIDDLIETLKRAKKKEDNIKSQITTLKFL